MKIVQSSAESCLNSIGLASTQEQFAQKCGPALPLQLRGNRDLVPCRVSVVAGDTSEANYRPAPQHSAFRFGMAYPLDVDVTQTAKLARFSYRMLDA